RARSSREGEDSEMHLKGLKARLGQVLAVTAMTALLPAMAWSQQLTCNGLVAIDYVSGPNFAVPGDTLRVRLSLGAASISGGAQVAIQKLRFDLDCDADNPLALPCTDEGLKVEYEGDGTITSACPGVLSFTSGHAVSGAPNEVVFTPNATIIIPANQPVGYCQLEFDVKVLARSNQDATPNVIEEVGGYLNTEAMCNNGVLASGGSQSSGIQLCPVCTDTECATSACNQQTGMCVGTNKPDSTTCGDTDGNLCTTAGCEMGQCVQT